MIARLLALILVAASLAPVAVAQRRSSGGPVHVRGYTRKDGTYVAPHYRSAPNGTSSDNWSTKGNVNPYTGEAGTKAPSGTPGQPPSAQAAQGTGPAATQPAGGASSAELKAQAEAEFAGMSDGMREATIRRIRELGFDGDTDTLTDSALFDVEIRLAASLRLVARGVRVDWKRYSALEILELEAKLPASPK